MKKSEIKAFQKLSRPEQLRELLAGRIEQGYTVEDFQRDYYASEQDCEDFRQIQSEILRK